MIKIGLGIKFLGLWNLSSKKIIKKIIKKDYQKKLSKKLSKKIIKKNYRS
jgi:hypothetical protein